MTLDRAKSLNTSEAIAARRQALDLAHMQPLVAFVARLRASAPAGVPDFDPMDGGVNAECLFLLEAPGSKAIGSGFVSRNNPDETARNFFEVNVEAGLPRLQFVVLVGRKAQRYGHVVAMLTPSVTVLTCPHPSPLSFNGRPERRAEVLACLAHVVSKLD